VGVATGIAWTKAGGHLMPVEVSLMAAKGSLILSGQLGQLIEEYAPAALTHTRLRAADFDIKLPQCEQIDIHIHVHEGAIPKDGPSAGVTIVTALVSALACRPVDHTVAMTGEITLRGRILPVGGLKEKVMAAHRAGIKTVIIPGRNEKDMMNIPKKVQRDLKFIFADRVDDAINAALAVPPPTPEPTEPTSTETLDH